MSNFGTKTRYDNLIFAYVDYSEPAHFEIMRDLNRFCNEGLKYLLMHILM